MLLYHGSNQEISKPKPSKFSRNRLDFGRVVINAEKNKDNFDLVIGPVADDGVLPTLLAYDDGTLTKSQAIENLKTWKLVDQLVFKTERSVKMLEFKHSWELKNGNENF